MAEMLLHPAPFPTTPPAGSEPCRLRLELRHGAAKPAFYEVADASFLVGSIPGCDLRLPGAGLPPVICLLARRSDGVHLRKLAPTVPLQVNGRTVSSTSLANGDRLAIGPVELIAHLEEAPRSASPAPADADDRSRQLDARQKQLEEQARELETDRVIWYRRREEIEKECRQQREAAATLAEQLEGTELSQAHAELEQREEAIESERDRLAQLQRDLAAREEAVARQRQEQDTVRQELATIRQQLYDRYRERRDRLAGLQEAVNKAARKVQERKQEVDAQTTQASATRAEQEARQTEQDARAGELDALRRTLQEERERWEKQCDTHNREIAERQAAFQAEQARLTQQRETLEKSQIQHQTDLVRLDRREAELEDQYQRLLEREQEINRRSEQLQHDTLDLEEQARQLDEWHTRLRTESDQVARQNAELEPQRMELAQRAAAMEGQQTMLATLRARLERLREETRHEAQQLAEQRARQESTELDLNERQEESDRLRAELDAERQALEQEKRRYEERGASLETAVARTRELHEALAKQETELRQRTLEADSRAAEQTEQEAVLQARAAQLTELQQRLEADRQALKSREADLARAEQVRAALQEQLHRRSEELAARQRLLTEQARRQEEAVTGFQTQVAAVETQRLDLQRERQQMEERLAARGKELESQQAALDGWNQKLEMSRQKLQDMGRTIAAERKNLAEERARRDIEQRGAEHAVEQSRSEIAVTRQEALQLHQQLPELEQRAAEAVERLGQARDRLREHLAELHDYARQGQEDLEGLRTLVRSEAEQVHEQALALHRARNEHRLAVAAFRQHIIDWQGQIGEMKRALSQGETRLEQRKAEVDEQARKIDATSARLAQQAALLEAEQRQVAVRRGEMERHLADMREWYRRKLRELAVGKESADPPSPPAATAPAEAAGNGRDILALTGDLDPGDRQLGDLLRSLELVDAETLNVLLVEARRQRRSLRQVLLAGNYLTLYQLALIEAGNLDGLVLGPTRVVDRVRMTSREAVYRVFDPRRGREAMLRHLAEAEAVDAVRPDEFRQRFAAAAAVQHPHLAGTLEVLEIAGRPAVLLECLTGLPSQDWPALAAVPGVWYRLLSQAALGLHTAHQAGLIHGHLRPESALLTAEGVLKLRGFGEPVWLVEPPEPDDENVSHGPITDDVEGDLAALGSVAADWVSAPRRKGSRAKPLPASLQDILRRLNPEAGDERFVTAAALLEALDHAGADVSPNAEAWDRLVHYVRDHRLEPPPLRQSA